MPTVLTLPLPARFSLAHAVCSYGYFILAPNRWVPSPDPQCPDRGALHRPLRDTNGRAVRTRLSQTKPNQSFRGSGSTSTLIIRCHRRVARRHHAHLKRQVVRMLRLDEDARPWRRLHPAAARAKFDRLFRSPTLFEDIVKTITGCNITWPSTVRMNRLLCAHVGIAPSSSGGAGAFPTPAELASWAPSQLAERCKVGYRAERIIRLARDVEAGRLDLAWFEQPERTTDELYRALRRIHGIGDYAANNILQLLGHYDRLPVDTETLRHFRHLHDVHGDLPEVTAAAQRHYEKYAPYQFLAYWYELWRDYERRFGPAHRWPEDVHTRFTARELR